VIVLVPITFRVPAVLVFIPPLMTLTPAMLAYVVQFTTLVIGLPAVAPVSFDCLVQIMFCVDYPSLTSVHVFRLKVRDRGRK